MAGGVPAGINILPGEEGCLINSTRIRIMTMQGKRMTTPSGTDMLEFPLNLSGLRKKARRDANDVGRGLTSRRFSSAVGNRGGPVATSLLALRNRSMSESGISVYNRRASG